jgi:hypothetical protein
MKCDLFRSKFINTEQNQLDEDAFSHIGSCARCKRVYELSTAALNQLEKAECPAFNLYFTEKVLGKLSNRYFSAQSNSIRYALFVSVFVTFLVGGLTIYVAHSKNQPQQYDMLSLNDNTKPSVAFDK